MPPKTKPITATLITDGEYVLDMVGAFVPKSIAQTMKDWLEDNHVTVRTIGYQGGDVAQLIQSHYPGGLKGWCVDNKLPHQIAEH